jgi:uncharacterized membrane protein YadS
MYSQQAHQPEALAAASVAKLLRNLSIAVLVPLAAWLTQRHEARTHTDAAGRDEAGAPPAGGLSGHVRLVPMFVLGFLACIILRTVGDAVMPAGSGLWQALIHTGYTASDLFLTCGMTAVGLSVAFTDMWRIGWRPLAAGFAVATLVGGCSLAVTLGMLHFFG